MGIVFLIKICDNRAFPPALLDQVIPLFFSPATIQTNPELPLRFRKNLETLPEEKISGIAALGRVIFSRPDLLEKLPSLDMPVLVVVGKDDIPRPPKEAQEMAALLPQGSLIEIPNAGHISNLEQVESVNQTLSKFLTFTVHS